MEAVAGVEEVRADRVGLGWRAPLAADILRNLDAIDVLEVVAEMHMAAPRREVDALRQIGAQVPLLVHGLSLGMASTSPVDGRLLRRLARFVDQVCPESWSEHLAFVRAGGVEIGHLAQAPRTDANIDSTVRNLRRAHRTLGSAPLVENIASLVQPPGSTYSESQWIQALLDASDCDMLLDLHNLHANAYNFQFDAVEFIQELPPERIRAVHLAGGRLMPVASGAPPMLLDDHCHAIPEEVFALLTQTAAHATQPLTVIVERDGNFPPMHVLLAELQRAREALHLGRESRSRPTPQAAVC